MNTSAVLPSSTPPGTPPVNGRVRWEGTMVLFELATEQGLMECAISRTALEELGPSRCFRKDDALACFAAHRGLIEARALDKLNGLPAGWSGRLTLWADDLDPEPPDDEAAADATLLQQAG